MLAAIRDQYLLRGAGKSTVTHGLDRNGLTQFGQTSSRGIALVLHLAAGLDGCFDDVLGGGEIRLASTEANDIETLGFQGLCLGVDRQGG